MTDERRQPGVGPMGEKSHQDPTGVPGRDPNYILSQEEFHDGIAALDEAAARRHFATRDELLEAIGWGAISIGLWIVGIGFLLKGGARRHG